MVLSRSDSIKAPKMTLEHYELRSHSFALTAHKEQETVSAFFHDCVLSSNDSIITLKTLHSPQNCGKDFFPLLEPLSPMTSTVTSTFSPASRPWPIVSPEETSFVARNCSNSTDIGANCNVSASPCDILHPCRNLGQCLDKFGSLRGFSCVCTAAYRGIQCELVAGPCQQGTCFHGGEGYLSSLSLFV